MHRFMQPQPRCSNFICHLSLAEPQGMHETYNLLLAQQGGNTVALLPCILTPPAPFIKEAGIYQF